MPIIDAADFRDTINEYLEEFGDDAYQANSEAITKVAKSVSKDLKKAGSFGGTGKFRKAITYEIQKNRVNVEATVGAGKHAGLTHLLEFGHAKQNGGRTKAFNFVAPINDTVEQRYIKEMEALLK